MGFPVLIGGFVVYLALKGRLQTYIALATGKASTPSATQPNVTASRAMNGLTGLLSGTLGK